MNNKLLNSGMYTLKSEAILKQRLQGGSILEFFEHFISLFRVVHIYVYQYILARRALNQASKYLYHIYAFTT